MTEVEKINKELFQKYSLNPMGEPMFRIVWSDDAREYRKGKYCDFYNDIFIRETVETRLTKKYDYIHERWILEKWAPPELTSHSELPLSYKGSYEPVWVFEDKKGEYVAPIQRAVDIIINMMNNPVHMTPEERRDMFQKMEDLEVLEFEDQIEVSSPIENALHLRQAVGYTKEIKNAS